MRQADRDAAFSAYVAARRTYLRRFAYTLCGDWHQAEDLLQISLTKLYVAWPRVQREAAQDSYARRIILHANIDEHRRPWRREKAGLDGVAEEGRTEPGPEERDELLTALAALPPMQRRCVVLRHWVDLSVEETARELDIAPGTVKAHTHRAVQRLRALLGEDIPESTRS